MCPAGTSAEQPPHTHKYTPESQASVGTREDEQRILLGAARPAVKPRRPCTGEGINTRGPFINAVGGGAGMKIEKGANC